MKHLTFCFLYLLLFLTILKFTSAEMVIIGISPINRTVCMSGDEIRTANYTVSINSSKEETVQIYVLDLNWIHVNDSIETTPPISAAEVPFYLVPNNMPDGNYTTRIWACTKEIQTNVSGYKTRTCLEGHINVELSEKCRTQTYRVEYLLIILVPLMSVAFYLFRKK